MTQFNLKAFIAHADWASMPTHSHGLVYEPWQQERSDKARDLIAALVPADQQDAAEAALRAKGIIEDDWMPSEGECRLGLDANTCPAGCFEREVSIADLEDDAAPGWAEKDLIAKLNAQLTEIQQEQEARLAAKAANRRRWTGAVTGCLVLALALYILACVYQRRQLTRPRDSASGSACNLPCPKAEVWRETASRPAFPRRSILDRRGGAHRRPHSGCFQYVSLAAP